jgi:PAS domain S-box-containing protein
MGAEKRALDRQLKVTAVDLGPDNWNLLRTVVDTAPECIKVVAADGRLLQMNAAGLRMIDAGSWDAVDGACVFDLIAPEHRHAWREHHGRVCRGETLTWQFDIIGLTGVRRRMETSAVPVTLSDGSVGQLAFTRDITARSETERGLQQLKQALEETVSDQTKELRSARKQLQEAERNFERLVDSVTDYAIYMLDPGGRVVSWNAGARRIKGYEAEEIIGQHFSRFYTEEDRTANLPMASLETAARDGRVEREGWRVRKDGSRFWANAVIDAIRDRGRLIGFAKVTRDITEKRAAEARLRQSQKMEAVGQFTGGAAHDFSNLLMAISGSLELLRKRLPDDQRMLCLLDNAIQASKRGISLTQRMLAFARRQELKLEAVDLVALVNGMQELLERSVGSSVRLDIRFTREIPAVVADSNQVETALLNLALNARDAMPGGGTITITAEEAAVALGHPTNLAPGPYVCLSFTDTGHGMDEATLARITEPFFTTKGVGKGTGLGLAMVDGLCAQSGGKLVIESRLHQGTTIELWLPVAGTAVIASEGAAPAEAKPAAAYRALRVLVVDDDALVLKSTIAMLEDLGHEAIGAPSGERALDIINGAGTPFDLVIADQVMPDMTGLQLAHAIKALKPALPVILATGYAELSPGTDPTIARLTKPFTQRQLGEVASSSARNRNFPRVV